jgi:hypothetical protein
MPNEGTTNRADGKRFKLAVQAALKRKGKDQWEALTDIAEKLVDEALAGNMPAIKEIADRIEGKAAQQVMLTDGQGDPLKIQLVTYAKPNDTA